jgi:hypothetical protein
MSHPVDHAAGAALPTENVTELWDEIQPDVSVFIRNCAADLTANFERQMKLAYDEEAKTQGDRFKHLIKEIERLRSETSIARLEKEIEGLELENRQLSLLLTITACRKPACVTSKRSWIAASLSSATCCWCWNMSATASSRACCRHATGSAAPLRSSRWRWRSACPRCPSDSPLRNLVGIFAALRPANCSLPVG